MAYVDQAKKTRIASALRRVVPSGWKYSLSVRNHSTIVLTIQAAPFDLLGALAKSEHRNPAADGWASVNHHHLGEVFEDECVRDIFQAIVGALNTDNHDRSDSATDYFDVGHYLDVRIGRWGRPFVQLPAPALR